MLRALGSPGSTPRRPSIFTPLDASATSTPTPCRGASPLGALGTGAAAVGYGTESGFDIFGLGATAETDEALHAPQLASGDDMCESPDQPKGKLHALACRAPAACGASGETGRLPSGATMARTSGVSRALSFQECGDAQWPIRVGGNAANVRAVAGGAVAGVASAGVASAAAVSPQSRCGNFAFTPRVPSNDPNFSFTPRAKLKVWSPSSQGDVALWFHGSGRAGDNRRSNQQQKQQQCHSPMSARTMVRGGSGAGPPAQVMQPAPVASAGVVASHGSSPHCLFAYGRPC